MQLVEVLAEHFRDGGQDQLRRLADNYPIVLHTEALSPGTPEPLDTDRLSWFRSLVDTVDPLWLSDHVGFRHSEGIDLGVAHPVPLTRESLACMTDRMLQIAEAFRKPVLLENLAFHLSVESAIPEPEFLNRLCSAAGCGLLLDVTALYVNSRNHRFDAQYWLGELEPRHIVQLHVGGVTQQEDVWDDTHNSPIIEPVWELLQSVLEMTPVRAVVLERDGMFLPYGKLVVELERLQRLLHAAYPDQSGPIIK
jgi:uncharacterized protein (UPF0276 family)